MKFAQILIANEGKLYAYEAAIEAGYSKDRARQEASELQNPQKSPLVVRYISELRKEMQKKNITNMKVDARYLENVSSEEIKVAFQHIQQSPTQKFTKLGA